MVFNVLSIAAVGDGVIDDSKAFKNTACNVSCSSQIFLRGTAYNFYGALLCYQYGYKIIVTLMAPDGLEAGWPKTSKQEWLAFISIKGNVIARG
ncbi:hypothetical protein CFP56_003184 [Quercus suber]|uniref:Polygalacturonase n=1 Tax=Quercus suber TaxID=58331 RepID=A0AAW0IJU6_QUESU